MMPFVPLARAAFGVFDPRVVTLLAFVAAGILAYRLGSSPALGLSAAAAVWVSPLVYWQQIFGANDIVVAALLLGAVHCARVSRAGAAAALLGLACATKQLAWPFAPFLLAHLSGATTLGVLVSAPARGRLLRALAVTAGRLPRRGGSRGRARLPRVLGRYRPLQRGPGRRRQLSAGRDTGPRLCQLPRLLRSVSSLRDHVPLGGLYLLLVPIGVWLLREQLRRGTAADALVTGSAALLLSLYVSRVVHPNYFILAACSCPPRWRGERC
jgi:hypothetical protein